MIGKVRQGEELNEKNLINFLLDQDLIFSLDGSLQIRQFTNGFSNLTYKITIEDKDFVLRRPPFGAIKRGHDMSREFKVLKNLYPGYKTIPRPLAFADDIEIIGAPFYLMEMVEGIILSYPEAKARNISESGYQKIANQWLKRFVELHQIDFKEVGLKDLGKPEGYVERQVKGWSSQYLKAATKEISQVNPVMTWMAENCPNSYDHSLIHNDFKYDNVVFKDDSWTEIIAILDWEMCTLGDPLMDLGSSLAYWTIHSDHPMMKEGLKSPTVFKGNPSRNEIVNNYALLSNRNVDNIIFYYVYGLFKLAVIVQQIYYRYEKGITMDERFSKFDQSAEFLILLASQAISKKRIENLI